MHPYQIDPLHLLIPKMISYIKTIVFVRRSKATPKWNLTLPAGFVKVTPPHQETTNKGYFPKKNHFIVLIRANIY